MVGAHLNWSKGLKDIITVSSGASCYHCPPALKQSQSNDQLSSSPFVCGLHSLHGGSHQILPNPGKSTSCTPDGLVHGLRYSQGQVSLSMPSSRCSHCNRTGRTGREEASKGRPRAVTEGRKPAQPAIQQPLPAVPAPYLPSRTSDHQDCVPPRSWRHAGKSREQETGSDMY